MPDPAPVNSLTKKMCAILAEVSRIPKNGTNTAQNYKYAMEADVADAIRPLLAQHGIFAWPRVTACVVENHTTSKGSIQRIARVQYQLTFEDAETGEIRVVEMAGEGADFSDKGIFKAITGANKYAILKAFQIATGDDPEDDSRSNAPASASRSDGPAKQARPATVVATPSESAAKPPVSAGTPLGAAGVSARTQTQLVDEMKAHVAQPVKANTEESGCWNVTAWIRGVYVGEGKAPSRILYVLDSKGGKESGIYAKMWTSGKNEPDGSRRLTLLNSAKQHHFPVILSLEKHQGKDRDGKPKLEHFIEGVAMAEQEVPVQEEIAQPEPAGDEQYDNDQPF